MTTILFICSGNTCRSPMAACLFNAYAAKLGRTDIQAVSAGVSAIDGLPASDGAARAMERRGLSLKTHRSHMLTEQMLRGASLVIGMSEGHTEAARMRYPHIITPMRGFNPPVSDPYGGGNSIYEATAAELEERVKGLIGKL